jgi:hypothetical protein
MNIDHLKYCADPSHGDAYRCVRCNQPYCLFCDHATDKDSFKTVVRYCPDWRCKREQRLEEISIGKVADQLAKEVREFVRDRFTPGSVNSLDELQTMVRRNVMDMFR